MSGGGSRRQILPSHLPDARSQKQPSDSPGVAELCGVQGRTGRREDPWDHCEFSPWTGATECQGWGCTRPPGLCPAPLPPAPGDRTGAVALGSHGRGHEGFRPGHLSAEGSTGSPWTC